MEWYVFRYDFNANQIIKWNVFDNIYLYEFMTEGKHKFSGDFAEDLKTVCMHEFWSRYQYEMIIADYTDKHRTELKVDVWDQLQLNWEAFVKYCQEKYLTK